jgi:hypothetical protein
LKIYENLKDLKYFKIVCNSSKCLSLANPCMSRKIPLNDDFFHSLESEERLRTFSISLSP